jgi:predicted small secreted protein
MNRKHAWIAASASLTLLALAAGCNTVKGLGKDIETVGEKSQEVITNSSTTKPAK